MLYARRSITSILFPLDKNERNKKLVRMCTNVKTCDLYTIRKADEEQDSIPAIFQSSPGVGCSTLSYLAMLKFSTSTYCVRDLNRKL